MEIDEDMRDEDTAEDLMMELDSDSSESEDRFTSDDVSSESDDDGTSTSTEFSNERLVRSPYLLS